MRDDKGATNAPLVSKQESGWINAMKKVVLYGKSLVMSSIGASLQSDPDLDLLQVDPSLPDAQQRVSDLQPDAFIFDLATLQPDFAILLWKAKPDLVLIGVDVTTGNAQVFSSQPARAVTTDDLVQLLRRGDFSQEIHGASEPGPEQS